MLEMQLFMNKRKKRETKQNDGGGQNNNNNDNMVKEFGRTHANEMGRSGEWEGREV